jgi:hypothetical protein
MKIVNAVLFIIISFAVSGCGVSVDRGAGVIHTSGFLGDMSHGYVDHSGLTVVNPSRGHDNNLSMEVTYSVHMRLDRSSPLWGESQRSNSYPIVEVYRETLPLSTMGGDVFVPATELSDYRNILRVTVSFYDSGGYVDSDTIETTAYFYYGTWKQSWSPRPRS